MANEWLLLTVGELCSTSRIPEQVRSRPRPVTEEGKKISQLVSEAGLVSGVFPRLALLI